MLHVKSDQLIGDNRDRLDKELADIDALFAEQVTSNPSSSSSEKIRNVGSFVDWYGPFDNKDEAVRCAATRNKHIPNFGLCLFVGKKKIRRFGDIFSKRSHELQYIGGSPIDIESYVAREAQRGSTVLKKLARRASKETVMDGLSKKGIQIWIGFLADPRPEKALGKEWPQDLNLVRQALIYALQPQSFHAMKGAFTTGNVIVRNRWFSGEGDPKRPQDKWCPDIVDIPCDPGPLSLIWIAPSGQVDREQIVYRNDDPCNRSWVWDKVRDFKFWSLSLTRSLVFLFAVALFYSFSLDPEGTIDDSVVKRSEFDNFRKETISRFKKIGGDLKDQTERIDRNVSSLNTLTLTVNRTQNELSTLKTTVQGLLDQIASLQDGDCVDCQTVIGDRPSCLLGTNGKIDALYSVQVTDSSFIVNPQWNIAQSKWPLDHLDFMSDFHGEPISFNSTFDQAQFETTMMPYYNHSVTNKNCRLFVDIIDGTTGKDAWKNGLSTVERYFYKRSVN